MASAKDTTTLFAKELTSPAAFQNFGAASTGIIRQGETLKFLIDRRNAKQPEMYYINSNYCGTPGCTTPVKEAQSHYHFAKKVLKVTMSEPDYVSNAYDTSSLADRLFYDGRVQKFILPQDGKDIIFYGVRFIERDLANQEMIKFTLELVKKTLRITDGQVAFMVNSQDQKVDEITNWAAAQSIPIFTMEDILSGVDFIGLNPGTAYGFIRFAPEEPDDLDPYEIPVFEEMPLDLSVVAGTITTQYQDNGEVLVKQARLYSGK